MYIKLNNDEESLFFSLLRFCSLNVIHAKKLTYGSSWQVNHLINTNELFFVRKGAFHLEMEGHSYNIGENCMVCIPANSYRNIYIEKDCTAEFYSMQFYAETGGVSYFNYIEHLPPVDMTDYRVEAERLFSALADIGEPMSHPSVLRRIGLAGELLAFFLEKAGAKAKIPEKRSHIDFGIIMAHIDRFYRYRKLTTAELAGLVKVSEGYFRREFKKEYGISCGMYINSLRIEGALKMLRETDAPLKTIAENYQYSDTTYLSRVVKQQTGLTPTEYRNKFKQ